MKKSMRMRMRCYRKKVVTKFVSYIHMSAFGIRLDPQLRLLRFEAVESILFMGLTGARLESD